MNIPRFMLKMNLQLSVPFGRTVFARMGFDIGYEAPYFIYRTTQRNILHNVHSFHSVVVIASALHAEGP
jgi:hypothetical protein